MDLIGEIPTSSNGYCWILTIIDIFSNFTIIKPLKSKKILYKFILLFEKLFALLVLLKIIQSDQGKRVY